MVPPSTSGQIRHCAGVLLCVAELMNEHLLAVYSTTAYSRCTLQRRFDEILFTGLLENNVLLKYLMQNPYNTCKIIKACGE